MPTAFVAAAQATSDAASRTRRSMPLHALVVKVNSLLVSALTFDDLQDHVASIRYRVGDRKKTAD